MSPSHKPSFALAGGLALLAASVSIGSWRASAGQPPPTPQTVNQGTPGSSPWPVSATGTVNVGNLPATQPVSGTINVGNLPATQPVSGTVNVGNLPNSEVFTGYSSDVIGEGVGFRPAGNVIDTGPVDTTVYRALRIYVSCVPTSINDCTNVQVKVTATPAAPSPFAASYTLDQFTLSDNATTTRIEDVPGPAVDVTITNGASNGVTLGYSVVGRTN